MNDFSIEWNKTIGIPAKCSSSGKFFKLFLDVIILGLIMIIIPKIMGISIYSPKLDSHEISVRY